MATKDSITSKTIEEDPTYKIFFDTLEPHVKNLKKVGILFFSNNSGIPHSAVTATSYPDSAVTAPFPALPLQSPPQRCDSCIHSAVTAAEVHRDAACCTALSQLDERRVALIERLFGSHLVYVCVHRVLSFLHLCFRVSFIFPSPFSLISCSCVCRFVTRS